MENERRRRRSHDPLVALHYQLSSTRREGSLDTIVVADGSGVVVAGAGSWASCEELAAFAPLIASGSHALDGVAVKRVDVDGDKVLLCARSTDVSARDDAMSRVAVSVSRILRAA